MTSVSVLRGKDDLVICDGDGNYENQKRKFGGKNKTKLKEEFLSADS